MRFTLGRAVHFYYVAVLVLITGVFTYGVKHYWDSGVLNVEYVSNLYDGTSKIKTMKERNDLEEIKKYVDGDRIKEANQVFSRLETDIKDLKSIKSTTEISGLDEQLKQIKQSLVAFQSAPELSVLLNNLSLKVTAFETFVTEKNWPTLTRMSTNLRSKISPTRLMNGGLYNFERTLNLTLAINNDLEAMTNFTESSGLGEDIKSAVVNRIKVLKTEAGNLNSYVEEHKKFNKSYKDFSTSYAAWFKLVEPEIAFKKIQFEKSSQTVIYSLIGLFGGLIASFLMGFVIYNYSTKYASTKTEKLVLDTIKEGLLPVESKQTTKFSTDFNLEFDKYRDYTHKRMAFGSIFQEAVPFASILLDSNLNMVWGNSHFYEQWQLENFQEDDDSLTWDFLQRFTNLSDNSAILSALRMSASGSYKIQVKSNTMAKAIPYEMYVSPVEYSSQKRILIIFYPLMEVEDTLSKTRDSIINPVIKALDLQIEEKMTVANKNELRMAADKAGAGELFSKLVQYIEKSESIRDELINEIEDLENQASKNSATMIEMRKLLVASFETQKSSIETYNQFKHSVTTVIDTREQLEEQFKYAINSSRELFKDQNRIFSAAEKAEKNVDEYIKSLKTITNLKGDFKELKVNVDAFKSRILQGLDQLLIFQGQELDAQRIEQFLGKIKIEMKGFEKVLHNFGEVVTMMDVTVMKVDMMVESRERLDLDSIRFKIESIKNNIENIQFSASKLSQNSHAKDDEMIAALKSLISNMKTEMKRINEMCKYTGMSSEHLDIITTSKRQEGRA